MKIISLLFCLSISCVGFAQTTWQGLKFGESEADVRKQYQGVFDNKVVTADGSFQLVDPGRKLIDNPPAGWKAAAHLHFYKNAKLAFIEVVMLDPAAETSPTVVISELTEKLVQKYGQPVNQTGDCRMTGDDIMESMVYNPGKMLGCKEMWKDAGQTITLNWFIQNKKLSFFGLTYEPLPSDI